MAEGTINAYNLADQGVNVDKAQIHKQDGELTKAQNCTTDPTGVGGGVRKRPGLVEFNAIAAGASILGGVGAPLALLANSINGTALTGGPSRTMLWGRQAKGAGIGATQGWWVSTTGFTTAASQILNSTPANPRALEVALDSSLAGVYGLGMPGAAVVYKNQLYYAGTYTTSTDRPTIRVFNGTTDLELVRVPYNSALSSGAPCTINSMLLVGDLIYLSVRDGTLVSDGAARNGRVFSLNPSTGALVQMGPNFAAGFAPYSLAWHAGRLWTGTENISTSVAGTINWFRPNIDSAWTVDRTISQVASVAFLYSFQGNLFAGNFSGTGTSTVVEKRDPLGAWTVSLTVGSVGTSSGFMNAVMFNGNLYVTHFNTTSSVSTVRKFDGTTWTIVLTTGDAKPLCQIWVDAGVIYAGGGGSNTTANLWTSATGAAASWTDRSANLTGANMTGLTSIGVLAV